MNTNLQSDFLYQSRQFYFSLYTDPKQVENLSRSFFKSEGTDNAILMRAYDLFDFLNSLNLLLFKFIVAPHGDKGIVRFAGGC